MNNLFLNVEGIILWGEKKNIDKILTACGFLACTIKFNHFYAPNRAVIRIQTQFFFQKRQKKNLFDLHYQNERTRSLGFPFHYCAMPRIGESRENIFEIYTNKKKKFK